MDVDMLVAAALPAAVAEACAERRPAWHPAREGVLR